MRSPSPRDHERKDIHYPDWHGLTLECFPRDLGGGVLTPLLSANPCLAPLTLTLGKDSLETR